MEIILQDTEGYQYRNLRLNFSTKTIWYEMKAPNQRWSGPFHGRQVFEFFKMKVL